MSALAITVSEGMIILDQQLEPWIAKSAKNHAYVQNEKNIPASAYYLLGSFTSEGDYHVAHVSKCPVPATALTENSDEKSRLLDDTWMSDNGERVVRILPGGLNIVGIAWFSTKKVFTESRNMITKTMVRLSKMNNSLTTLNMESITDTMVTVFVETPDTKPVGSVVDVVGKGNDSSTKVVFQKLEWISLVSNSSARVVFNVETNNDGRSDFYSDFTAMLKPFATNFFTCNTVLLDGQLRNDSEPLFKDLKKNKKTTVEAQLFIDPLFNRTNESIECVAENNHEMLFDIEVRAAVPVRSTVLEAKKALKHHLIRNLCARAELHYESMEIVENALPSTVVVHQLPRPATTVLYTHSAILLNEFLFEADSIEDAQKNFDDMLDLQTSIEHVDDGWERALTEEEMTTMRQPLEDVQFAEMGPEAPCCTTKTLLITVGTIVGVIATIIWLIISHS